MSNNRVFKGPLRRRRDRRKERRSSDRNTASEEIKKEKVVIREAKSVVVVEEDYTPISKSSESGYCLACLRDHLHKAKGLLREAEKQLSRDGEISPSIRRKIELVEEELSSAETEHVWNVQLENEGENRRLKAIGSQISNLRKDLENTQMGFRNPNIPVKGDVGDIGKAISRADEILDDVHDSMADCPTCSEAVGVGWSLDIAKQMGMMDYDILEAEVLEERISPQEAIDKMIEYAENQGKEDESTSLKEVKRLMYSSLSELEE